MKNRMKQLFLAALLFMGSTKMMGQADLGVNQALMSTNPISIGQTAQLVVDIRNFGFDDIPAGCALVTISVPSAIASIISVDASSDPMWAVFSSSLPASVTLRNTAGALPADFNPYNIVLNVQGVAIGGPLTINVSAALNPFQGGCAGLGNLDPSNDNATSSITVTALLPVKLSSFGGAAVGCNSLLKWTTQQEDNFDYFEVEYSADGINFIKAGTVRGRNSATGASYEFSYAQPSAKGYYRLKLVDRDGKVNYSGTAQVTNKCKEPNASLYPNPIKVQQDATVVLRNFGNTAYGYLYDAVGKQLQVIKLLNGTNKIVLRNYASGGYVLKIKDEENNSTSLRITIAR
jgi:hypothetical protein